MSHLGWQYFPFIRKSCNMYYVILIGFFVATEMVRLLIPAVCPMLMNHQGIQTLLNHVDVYGYNPVKKDKNVD